MLNSTRTFPRTVDGVEVTFDDEPKLPKLQNLATHTTDCKGAKTDKTTIEPIGKEWIHQSVNMMDDIYRRKS